MVEVRQQHRIFCALVRHDESLHSRLKAHHQIDAEFCTIKRGKILRPWVLKVSKIVRWFNKFVTALKQINLPGSDSRHAPPTPISPWIGFAFGSVQKLCNSFLVLFGVFVIHGSSLGSVTLSPTLQAWGLPRVNLASTCGNWESSELQLVTLGGWVASKCEKLLNLRGPKLQNVKLFSMSG